MAIERTFSIIKPDAVKRNLIGAIYQRIEAAGLRVVGAKMVHLNEEQASASMRSMKASLSSTHLKSL